MALRLAITQGHDLLNGVPDAAVVGPDRPFVIGRDDRCDWALPDAARQISGRHCEIGFIDGAFRLRDLSTNGTFLDSAEERVEGTPVLAPAARIRIGPYVITVTEVSADVAAQRTDPPSPTEAAQGAPPAARPVLRRNADPAAAIMAARAHLAEAAPKAVDDDDPGSQTYLTKIRPAPSRPTQPSSAVNRPGEPVAAARTERPVTTAASAPPAAPAAPEVATAPVSTEPAAAPPVVAPPSAASPGADPQALIRRAAAGLGIDPALLTGIDPGDLVERLGVLARFSAESLKAQLDEKTARTRKLRLRLRLGGRSVGVNPLKVHAVEQALAQMLRSDAASPAGAAKVMARSLEEVTRFRAKVDAAVAAAVAQLAGDLAPDAIEVHCADFAPPDRLAETAWELYRILWNELDADWRAGFAQAFDYHVAEAFSGEA